MRVYRIEFREYNYQFTPNGGSDWNLSLTVRVKFVMADNSLDAVDLLRNDLRHQRIEIACVENVCKVDLKK